MSIFGLFESRVTLENPAVPLTSLSLLNWMAGPGTDSGIPVNEVTALNMSAVYRATALIGGLSGALSLQQFERGTKAESDNPLVTDPHPEMTPLEFWRLCGVHRCLWGNFYAQKMRHRGSGAVESLLPITPSRVRVGRAKPIAANPSGKVFEVTDDDGMQQAMTPREIFHVPGLGYDGLCGFSPVRMAAQAIGLGLAAERYAAKLFGSGNLMSGLMQTDQKLDQAKAEELQERWMQRMSGLDNAHKVAVLDAGAKFQSLTMPNDAAQFLQSREFQVFELARFFGIPPYLLFETEKSTSWGTGLEQQANGFVKFDLHPMWLAPVEQRITKELCAPGKYVKYNLEVLLRGDSIARAEFYRVMREVGAYSANDIRALEDLPPVENGAIYLQPMNFVPIGTDPTMSGSLGPADKSN